MSSEESEGSADTDGEAVALLLFVGVNDLNAEPVLDPLEHEVADGEDDTVRDERLEPEGMMEADTVPVVDMVALGVVDTDVVSEDDTECVGNGV